jgi:hypothetical protein
MVFWGVCSCSSCSSSSFVPGTCPLYMFFLFYKCPCLFCTGGSRILVVCHSKRHVTCVHCVSVVCVHSCSSRHCHRAVEMLCILIVFKQSQVHIPGVVSVMTNSTPSLLRSRTYTDTYDQTQMHTTLGQTSILRTQSSQCCYCV